MRFHLGYVGVLLASLGGVGTAAASTATCDGMALQWQVPGCDSATSHCVPQNYNGPCEEGVVGSCPVYDGLACSEEEAGDSFACDCIPDPDVIDPPPDPGPPPGDPGPLPGDPGPLPGDPGPLPGDPGPLPGDPGPLPEDPPLDDPMSSFSKAAVLARSLFVPRGTW